MKRFGVVTFLLVALPLFAGINDEKKFKIKGEHVYKLNNEALQSGSSRPTEESFVSNDAKARKDFSSKVASVNGSYQSSLSLGEFCKSKNTELCNNRSGKVRVQHFIRWTLLDGTNEITKRDIKVDHCDLLCSSENNDHGLDDRSRANLEIPVGNSESSRQVLNSNIIYETSGSQSRATYSTSQRSAETFSDYRLALRLTATLANSAKSVIVCTDCATKEFTASAKTFERVHKQTLGALANQIKKEYVMRLCKDPNNDIQALCKKKNGGSYEMIFKIITELNGVTPPVSGTPLHTCILQCPKSDTEVALEQEAARIVNQIAEAERMIEKVSEIKNNCKDIKTKMIQEYETNKSPFVEGSILRDDYSRLDYNSKRSLVEMLKNSCSKLNTYLEGFKSEAKVFDAKNWEIAKQSFSQQTVGFLTSINVSAREIVTNFNTEIERYLATHTQSAVSDTTSATPLSTSTPTMGTIQTTTADNSGPCVKEGGKNVGIYCEITGKEFCPKGWITEKVLYEKKVCGDPSRRCDATSALPADAPTGITMSESWESYPITKAFVKVCGRTVFGTIVKDAEMEDCKQDKVLAVRCKQN